MGATPITACSIARWQNRLSIFVGGAIWMATVCFFVWYFLGRSESSLLIVGLVYFGIVGLFAWRVFRVKLETSDTGLTVLNVFSDHQIPWEKISSIDRKSCWHPLWQSRDLGAYAVTITLRDESRIQSEATLNMADERLLALVEGLRLAADSR